jgi:hypothetical protein
MYSTIFNMDTEIEQLPHICPNCRRRTERYLAYKAFGYISEYDGVVKEPITSTEIEIEWCKKCCTGVEVKRPVLRNIDLDDLPF